MSFDIIGYSMGGQIAIFLNSVDNRLNRVIACALPLDTKKGLLQFGMNEEKAKRKGRNDMSDGYEDQLVGFVAGLLLGAAIGTTAALLSAPQSGRRTRRRLGRAALEIRKSTGGRFDDVAEEVRDRVDEVLKGARKRLGSE